LQFDNTMPRMMHSAEQSATAGYNHF
jgi:hypothetical protein